MPTFPLLANPAEYRPCIQNLLADGAEVRTYWLDLFVRHLDTLAALPVDGRLLRDHPRWPALQQAYLHGLEQLRREPDGRGRLDVLELTRFREEQLAAAGIHDPFQDLKQLENARAVAALPEWLGELDAAPPTERHELLLRGLLAGNLFDMGCEAAVEAYAAAADGHTAATRAFAQFRKRLPPRPWTIDDLDRLLPKLRRNLYRRVLIFVDNSGPDIILGAIPLARELAVAGAHVTLAANSTPTLNDVTAAELTALLDRHAPTDARLERMWRDRRITVVDSGGDAPLIDLRRLSPACCAAAVDCDLLILEGMGRAVESNFDARFTVDTLKVALIKDPMVARVLGVRLFEPVLRFEETALVP